MKKEINRNERGFGYIEFCSGSHGRIKTRIWIHNSLVSCEGEREFIEFPVQNSFIQKTEKNSLVLREKEGGIVYHIQIPSGYRGTAEINKVNNGEIVASGNEFHSGQGSLGNTAWAIINSTGFIEYEGEATGRRIDDPNVAYRVTPDGNVEELIHDYEVCNLMGEV